MIDIEKQAEEYKNKLAQEHYDYYLLDFAKMCFQDGAKWGMEHAIEWHDLRKNPADLPEEGYKFIIIALHNCITDEIITTVGTYEEFGNLLIGNVIAWCELPQYKDKE